MSIEEENIKLKKEIDTLKNENEKLNIETTDKNTMLQVAYCEIEEKEKEAQHFKDLFNAANTNLINLDEEIETLNSKYKTLQNEHNPLKDKATYLQKEYNDLKEIYEINRNINFNNGYIKNNEDEYRNENKNHTEGGGSKNENGINENGINYDCKNIKGTLKISEIEEWLLDYLNTACTFTKMKRHKFQVYENKTHKYVTKTAKNNKWTFRVILKLFLMEYRNDLIKKNVTDVRTESKECAICQDLPTDSCTLSCSCKYIYCYNCIAEWIKEHNCPSCRKNAFVLESDLLMPYHFNINRKNIPQYLKIFE